MCVNIWQRAEDSIVCQWTVAMASMALCALHVISGYQRNQSWGLLMCPDVSIGIRPQAEPCATCGPSRRCVVVCLQPSSSLQDRDAHWSRAQWVFTINTQSVQTTTHHPPPEPCPLAAVTPVISLTWWWWHVRRGGTARQHFVVYHRLKRQVFQLVGLALMAYTVCVYVCMCTYIHYVRVMYCSSMKAGMSQNTCVINQHLFGLYFRKSRQKCWCFPAPKSSNVLFCPQPRDIQFIVIEG